MSINHKKINEIVDENYVYASVLYYFGIKFFDYYEKTLEQVCKEKGLKIGKVIEELESVGKDQEDHQNVLFSYPIDVIIEYLKHTHYNFIKERLPYLAKLIENLSHKDHPDPSVIDDLKFVFPLFVEDLIHHIYEEEDHLFQFIIKLNDTLSGTYHISKVYYELERQSIQYYAVEHDMDDDEMKGIRDITHNYELNQQTSLHLRVVYAELQHFEKSLQTHSCVENEILFPKALMLEKEVKKLLKEKTRQN